MINLNNQLSRQFPISLPFPGMIFLTGSIAAMLILSVAQPQQQSHGLPSQLSNEYLRQLQSQQSINNPFGVVDLDEGFNNPKMEKRQMRNALIRFGRSAGMRNALVRFGKRSIGVGSSLDNVDQSKRNGAPQPFVRFGRSASAQLFDYPEEQPFAAATYY